MLPTHVRSLLKLCFKIPVYLPVAYYARGTRTPKHDARNFPEVDLDFDDPLLYQLTDSYEDMTVSEQEPRDIAPERKKIAFKTIQRKYFRPPQEVNLLTWDAKEQIRYLHQEFPNEWTLEKLAQSFPISVDGIRKLLRSKYQPRTIEEVIKHDRRVKKAWKALKDTERGKLVSGPVVMRYQMLKENNQLHLLNNATGHKQLPSSNWQQRLVSGKITKEQEIGVYQSIVTDYLKLKALKDDVMSSLSKKQQQMLADNSLSNNVYLQLVMKNLDQEQGQAQTTDVSSSAMKSEIKQNSRFIKKKRTERRLLKSELRHVDGFCEDDNIDKGYVQQVLSPSCTISQHRETDIGLKDTKKFTSDSQQKSDKIEESRELSDEEIKELQEQNISWLPPEKENPPRVNLEDSIFFESPEGSDIAEPYLYHPDKGYQYPFGRSKDLPKERTEVPKANKSSKNESVIYQDGKDVYDEDGEFLYRIP